MRRVLKATGITLVVLLLAGTGLYLYGLRVELDGGGTPHLAFVQSAESIAAEVAEHREAQRQQPAPAAAAATDPPAVETEVPPGAATTGESSGDPVPATPAAPAGTWPDFRGPLRDGHYRGPILTQWPAGGLTPLWKQPIGGGYASFAIAGSRAFTIEQRGTQEVVAAYDVASGRELWTNAWNAKFTEFMGGDGPRATPTWHAGRVYALGAAGEFRALDGATGRTIWRTNILDENGARNLDWGMAAAPLVVNDTVVVLPGGPNGRSLVAYDTATGKRSWSALDDPQAYSSPMLATLAGVPQLVVFSASRVMGLTPDRGEVLWEYPWTTYSGINAGQPLIIGDSRVFISTGYGTGAAVVEITSAGGRLAAREVWRNNRMKNQFTSSVLHDGYIYGLDESILACMDANTGELKWKGGRYGYGQVMLASGHLIVLTEDGDLALVRATPTRHEELTRFAVLEGKTWNHPAIANGILLVRNLAEMAAFNLRVR